MFFDMSPDYRSPVQNLHENLPSLTDANTSAYAKWEENNCGPGQANVVETLK